MASDCNRLLSRQNTRCLLPQGLLISCKFPTRINWRTECRRPVGKAEGGTDKRQICACILAVRHRLSREWAELRKLNLLSIYFHRITAKYLKLTVILYVNGA